MTVFFIASVLALMALSNKSISGIGKLEFSPNRKLNGVLSDIRDDLLYSMGDDPESAKDEILRYKREFPRKSDYNIVEYGNLLVYNDDIRDFYRKHGYKSMDKLSDDALWDTYKRQVGWVVRNAPEFR